MSVVRDDEREFALHVPIVIVGAGACGLVAALAAHDAGAEVLVLERDAQPAGSTALEIASASTPPMTTGWKYPAQTMPLNDSVASADEPRNGRAKSGTSAAS